MRFLFLCITIFSWIKNMQNFSLHTHTLGFDGKNTEQEMLNKASEKGLKTIGFSNHFIVHPSVKESKMYYYAVKGGYETIYSSSFVEAINRFKPHYAKIDELKEKTKLNILKGMEVDFFASQEWWDGFQAALQILKPDYLIGSAHFIEYKNTLYNMHDLKNASYSEQQELLHQYWQNERNTATSGLFDFMAHLDLPKKVGLGLEPQWLEEKRNTIETIRANNVKVELNTSFFKFGSEPYPGPEIMRLLAEYKIPVLISDDAHNIERLTDHFEQTEQMAKSYGIKNFWQPLNLNILSLKKQNTLAEI